MTLEVTIKDNSGISKLNKQINKKIEFINVFKMFTNMNHQPLKKVSESQSKSKSRSKSKAKSKTKTKSKERAIISWGTKSQSVESRKPNKMILDQIIHSPKRKKPSRKF